MELLRITGQVGVPGNKSSGDWDCIMCYHHYYSWPIHSVPGQGHVHINVPPGGATIRFCTSPAGTGIYDPGRPNTGSVFGDAAPGRGNCLNQMKVKDWETIEGGTD